MSVKPILNNKYDELFTSLMNGNNFHGIHTIRDITISIKYDKFNTIISILKSIIMSRIVMSRIVNVTNCNVTNCRLRIVMSQIVCIPIFTESKC